MNKFWSNYRSKAIRFSLSRPRPLLKIERGCSRGCPSLSLRASKPSWKTKTLSWGISLAKAILRTKIIGIACIWSSACETLWKLCVTWVQLAALKCIKIHLSNSNRLSNLVVVAESSWISKLIASRLPWVKELKCARVRWQKRALRGAQWTQIQLLKCLGLTLVRTARPMDWRTAQHLNVHSASHNPQTALK